MELTEEVLIMWLKRMTEKRCVSYVQFWEEERRWRGQSWRKKSYSVAVVLDKNKDSREKAARCLCCSRTIEKNACHCEWKSVTLLKENCLSEWWDESVTGKVQKIQLSNVKSINSLRQKGQLWIGNLRTLFSFGFDRNMTSNRSKWHLHPGKLL